MAGESVDVPAGFSELDTNLYTLELYPGGQQVFAESGRSGPALAIAAFTLFYKKTITDPDGTTESQWCIGRQNAAPHAVASGPPLQVDMFVMRSEGSTLDNTFPPQPGGQIVADQQWFLQCWFRDPAAGGSKFNLSNGRALTFAN